MSDFYVYEHVRRDSGAVFYVGKGKGHRAKSKQGRNPYWRNVVEKAGGYDIRFAARGLSEELAHLVEVERIEQLRRLGLAITNLTDGGDGMAGHVQTAETRFKRSASMKGVPKSEEHRRNQSAACMGRRVSEEAKKKIGAAAKGRPSSMLGRRHTEAAKKKISEAVSGDRAPFLGRKHTPESLARMSAAHKGAKDSDETRLRKSIARRGDKNPRFGVAISDDQKARQIASLKARPRVTCPHCAKVMDESNAKRWHFDNCREMS